MTWLKGIDSSHWQTGYTNAAVRGFAPQFAVHKGTDGTKTKDPAFRTNFALSQSLGIPVLGVYHYLRHGSIADQMANFREVVKDPRGLITMVDVEDSAVTIDDVSAWFDLWRQQTSNYPHLLYTGDWFWRDQKHWIRGAEFGPLWAAPNRGYPGTTFAESDFVAGYGGWDRITIAQYVSNQVLGLGDYFDGTLDQLISTLTRDHAGIPTVPVPDQPDTYTVVAGDSLWVIAHKVYGTANWEPIATANHISAPYVIHPGQVLTIPDEDVTTHGSTNTYMVVAGDNLSHIAYKLYGDANKWKVIYNANRDRIGNPDLIYPGQLLRIP